MKRRIVTVLMMCMMLLCACSAIFLHCTGANTYTGGCIAVSEENMIILLKALDTNARIIIDYQ